MANEKEQVIPRFVLSLVDTHNSKPGPDGPQYVSVNIAANKISDFNRLIPKNKRTNQARTEVQAMFLFFQATVDQIDGLPEEDIALHQEQVHEAH